MHQGMKRINCQPLAVLSLLGLAACASDNSGYPSLARRDVERAAAAPSPTPGAPASPAPADPTLAEKLPRSVAAAQEAQRRFAAARGNAERLVSSGAGSSRGSEAWAVASIALAGLETARSEAMIALADLDALYADARINGLGGQSEIEAARAAVSAIIGEQDDVLAALRGRLGA